MAKHRVIDTGAAQFTVAYDGSNYAPFTCSATGELTIAPTGGKTSLTGHLALGGVSGSQYGTYFSAGTEGGNATVQGSVVPPSGASMAIITVQGDRYGGTAGAHDGYWFGQWQQGSNRIYQMAAADSTLGGTAQGFAVTWTGTAIQVANKSGMTGNQSGRVTILFFGS